MLTSKIKIQMALFNFIVVPSLCTDMGKEMANGGLHLYFSISTLILVQIPSIVIH